MGATVSFSEDFNNGSLNGWEYTLHGGPGTVQVVDGVIRTNTHTVFLSKPDIFLPSVFDVSFDAKLNVSAPAGSDTCYLILGFRESQSTDIGWRQDEYNDFAIHLSSVGYICQKPLSLDETIWHTLRFVSDGNTLSGYINGVLRGSANVSAYGDWLDGKFAIYTSSGSYDIDNIRGTYEVNSAPVPEPATLTLLGLAAAGIGFMRRRR